MTCKALIVDDDEAFLRFVTLCLAEFEFQVTALTRGKGVLTLVETLQPDIVYLDRILPDIDGFSLCQQIKLNHPLLPVLMFSNEGESEDVVIGLNVGADEYLPKPFTAELLLAKTRVLLRLYRLANQSEPEQLRAGDIEILPKNQQAFLKGAELPLTKTEFRLLLRLVSQPGQVLSRTEITTQILGYGSEAAFMESNIFFHINNLRKKLGKCRHYIETIHGIGYRFRENPPQPASPNGTI